MHTTSPLSDSLQYSVPCTTTVIALPLVDPVESVVYKYLLVSCPIPSRPHPIGAPLRHHSVYQFSSNHSFIHLLLISLPHSLPSTFVFRLLARDLVMREFIPYVVTRKWHSHCQVLQIVVFSPNLSPIPLLLFDPSTIPLYSYDPACPFVLEHFFYFLPFSLLSKRDFALYRLQSIGDITSHSPPSYRMLFSFVSPCQHTVIPSCLSFPYL